MSNAGKHAGGIPGGGLNHGRPALPGGGASAGVFLEEARHLTRGIRTGGVGVGTMAAAARPGVAGPVDRPAFHHSLAAWIIINCAGINLAVRHLSLLHNNLW